MSQLLTGSSLLTKGSTLSDEENKDVSGAAENPTPTTHDTVVVEPPADGETDSEESSKASEEAAEVEYVPTHVADGGRDYRVEGNDVSGYLGVDPEYMTYANKTEQPLLTEEEKFDYTDQYVGTEEYEPGSDGFSAEESDSDEADEVEPKEPLYPKEDPESSEASTETQKDDEPRDKDKLIVSDVY